MVFSKENVEKITLLQDTIEKLKIKVTQGRDRAEQEDKELQIIEHEVRKKKKRAKMIREELKKDEDDLISHCEQLRILQSQSSRHADPVIQRSSAMLKEQGVANSTASLGRANQLEPTERSSTLDAHRSNQVGDFLFTSQ